MPSQIVSIYACFRVRVKGAGQKSDGSMTLHLPRESPTTRAIARINARTELPVHAQSAS